MITPKIEEEAKLTIKELEAGTLPAEQKTQLVANINAAKESCNGLTQEEKLQAVAENQFYSSCILARLYNRLQKGTGRTWKDVVVEVMNSWKTVTAIGLLVFLFCIRPEVAAVLKDLAAK